MAVVLVITFVGLFYLSQTFEAAAARYEVAAAGLEREAMLQELQSQAGSTLALGSESTVTQWARDGTSRRSVSAPASRPAEGQMLGRTDRRWRSVAILIVMCAFAFAAVLRLAYWQVAMAPWLQRRANRSCPEDDRAARSGVTSSTGTAGCWPRPAIATRWRDTRTQLSPRQRQATVAGLTTILDLDERRAGHRREAGHPTTTTRSAARADRRPEHVRYARASPTGSYGSGPVPQLVRIYPNPGGQPGTTLASQLLGFVSATDGGSVGRYGIEARYDRILAGGSSGLGDRRTGAGLLDSAAQCGRGANGQDITISIDLSLQLQLEKELYAAWVADKAKRVSGLIMDPRPASCSPGRRCRDMTPMTAATSPCATRSWSRTPSSPRPTSQAR